MQRMKRISGALAGICALLLAVGVAMPTGLAAGVMTPIQDEDALLSPSGVLLGADGTLVVADSGLNRVVSIKNGQFQTLAGHTLPLAANGRPVGGYQDTDSKQALFNGPFAMAEWDGGIAVSDKNNHTVRWIHDGKVKTLAGDGTSGLRDGPAKKARFASPTGLAVSEKGVLYIADRENGSIRTLREDGTVSTYLRGLSAPTGLCWHEGALYVADAGTHQILKVVDGKKTIVAGAEITEDGILVGGFRDGAAADAAFCAPMGIAVEGGVIYVADTGNSAVRKIQEGWVSTLACFTRDTGTLPCGPIGLQAAGDTVYVADAYGGAVFALNVNCQLFADVLTDAPYANAVSHLFTEGVMQGTSAASFSPSGTCTRGQVAAMLYRLAGQPAHQGPAFPDVKSGMYYEAAICWAAGEKLMVGRENGLFFPNEAIRFQQMALILHRYAAWAAQKPLVETTMAAAVEWGVSIGTFPASATPAAVMTRGDVAQAMEAMQTMQTIHAQ